jgi:ParB-like chromosome segregation protein Spo0J
MPIQNQQSFLRQSILEARREASRVRRLREARNIPISAVFCSRSVALDTRNVAILADSFRQAGQTSAILVVHGGDESFRVVSGAHRVAAATELGWDQIAAVVLDCDERGQRLIEIAENLHRRDLSVLLRAELQNEWIELVREEAVQNARPSGGRQPKEQGLGKAARALGVSKEETMRASRIASISNEAKDRARELGFDDNQSALLRVAKVTTPGAQVALLQEIYEEKNAPRAGRVSRKKAEPADEAATTMATGAEAPELLQEAESFGVAPRQEGAPDPSPEYPDMLRELQRRPLDAEFKKLTDEWRSSRLRTMLDSGPIEARKRFVWEILFA